MVVSSLLKKDKMGDSFLLLEEMVGGRIPTRGWGWVVSSFMRGISKGICVIFEGIKGRVNKGTFSHR